MVVQAEELLDLELEGKVDLLGQVELYGVVVEKCVALGVEGEVLALRFLPVGQFQVQGWQVF